MFSFPLPVSLSSRLLAVGSTQALVSLSSLRSELASISTSRNDPDETEDTSLKLVSVLLEERAQRGDGAAECRGASDL